MNTERERERAKGKKIIWGCFLTAIGTLFGYLGHKFVFPNLFEAYDPKVGKWFNGLMIAVCIISCLFLGVLIYGYKKESQELAELSQQIKNLENSIR